MLDESYFPFTRMQLSEHFENENHLQYYETRAARYADFLAEHPITKGMKITNDVRSGRQIEKDERIWTLTALKQVFDTGRIPGLLECGFGDKPPSGTSITSWAEFCHVEDPRRFRLLFEVDLPSPMAYREHLKEAYHADQGPTLIPYVRDASMGSTTYEGPTQVDALLLNEENGCAVLIEAKALSDISCQVTFDMTRNQIIRNIDVMLEEPRRKHLSRKPDRTLFALLTPSVFRDHQRYARLYGWLYEEYKRRPAALQEHMPHRKRIDVNSVSQRLGWITYDDCNAIVPGACSWLE